jgi:hypothetical protein
MVPAKQRLEAGNDAGRKGDERLIIDFEFAGCERVAQIEFQRAAGSKAGVHIGLEKAKDAPAVFLGLIERHVGVPQKLIGGLAIGWRKPDAGAGSDHDLLTLDSVRLAQARHDAFGQGARLVRPGEPHLQNREFVAAKARDHVGGAHARAQALRHRLQKPVAGGVPQGVVDVLELIEIEIKNGDYFRIPAHAQQGFVQALVKQHPVWQTGQRRDAPYGRCAPQPGASPSHP